MFFSFFFFFFFHCKFSFPFKGQAISCSNCVYTHVVFYMSVLVGYQYILSLLNINVCIF